MASEVSKDTVSASSEAVERLEALARAATPGPWAFMGAEYADDGGRFFCVESQSHDAVIGEYGPDENDTAFIAAANPETILALISTLRSQAEALEKVRNTTHVSTGYSDLSARRAAFRVSDEALRALTPEVKS